jgi:hypothetical protein
MKTAVKDIIQHAWMFGTGAGIIGYGGQNQYIPGNFDSSLPMVDGMRIDYSEAVHDNMPWFMPCHTGSLIVPKGLDKFSNSRWFAQWIRRPLFEVENDPRLKNNKNLKPSRGTELKLPGDDQTEVGMVDLVIVRDKLFRKVFVLAPYATDKILFEDDDSLQINGRMACYPLIFNEDDEVFWGVPDSIILDPQQREINEIRTLQMRHRRLSIVKAFAKRGALKIEEIEKMTNEDILAVIQVDGDLADIQFEQIAHEPESLRFAGQEVFNDVRENLGFSRNQSGNYDSGVGGGGSRATATEAQIVQAASEIRIDERRDMVADMITDSFTDINTIIFENWKDDQVVGIMGPNQLPVWVAFKPLALKGVEYLMDVDPDSTLPDTKGMREQRAASVYALLKENPLIDPEKLTKYLLHEIHGVAFDDMMRSLGMMRSEPGGNPGQPISVEQMIQMQAQSGMPPPGGGS